MVGNKGFKIFFQPNNHRHHLGLGLPALVNLVRQFKGELWLASGKGLFKINDNQQEFYVELKNSWQGVAISFRFKLSCLESDYNSKNELVSELHF